jgi:glutamyl-Q tRNA(Asp) synthetase
MAQPVFRFAPSPNGRLHLGHAYSALLNEKLARQSGGMLLLRLEDIDHIRCPPELVQGVIDDLAWLGIAFEKPYRQQSQHGADYARALAQLSAMDLLYPCTCSRADVAHNASTTLTDHDGSPIYPQTCRNGKGKPGQRASLRLKMTEAISHLREPLFKHEDGGDWLLDPSEWGDVILARKDIGTSYHLAVTVDDHLQGVTNVVRGQDMAAATSIHRLLQELLGYTAPHYHHHPLIMRDHMCKLSKSDGDTSLADLRATGKSPDDIRRELGFV